MNEDIEQIMLEHGFEQINMGKHNIVYQNEDVIIKVNMIQDNEVRLLSYLKDLGIDTFDNDVFMLNINNHQYPIVIMEKMIPLVSEEDMLCDEFSNINDFFEDITHKIKWDDTKENILSLVEKTLKNNNIEMVLDITIENILKILNDAKDIYDNTAIQLKDISPINFAKNTDDEDYIMLDYGDYKDIHLVLPKLPKDKIINGCDLQKHINLFKEKNLYTNPCNPF